MGAPSRIASVRSRTLSSLDVINKACGIVESGLNAIRARPGRGYVVVARAESATIRHQARTGFRAANRTIYNAVMHTIAANDLKTQGVGAIERALESQDEALVSVRGQVKYVVMSQAHYQYLRECELEAALAQSRADLDAGRYARESVAQHMARLASHPD
jgi:hypothetical protein